MPVTTALSIAAQVTVSVPKRLGDRQKELLRELATLEGEEVGEEHEKRSFFGKKKKKG